MRSIFVAFMFGFVFVACDSGGPELQVNDVTVSGSVTEEDAYGKRADVEGAVVTATSVSADGSERAHADSAVVSATGQYSIRLRDVGSHIVLQAESPTLEARVVVVAEAADDENVVAAPMNEESTVEADVFVESRLESMDLTLAAIAAFVDARVAAEAAGGGINVNGLAELILMGQQAEEEYVSEGEPDEGPVANRISDKRASDREAYLTLQSSLAAAGSASAEASAIADFEVAFGAGFMEAGASASFSAEASDVRRAAIVRFSGETSVNANVATAVELAANRYAGVALGAAVKAMFEAEGAASATLDDVDDAVVTFAEAVAAAESRAEASLAFSAFRTSIEAGLAAELGVSTTLIEAASAAVGTARAALDVAVTAATDAALVAEAHATFYAAAETAASTTLSANAKAEFAADVIALLAAR